MEKIRTRLPVHQFLCHLIPNTFRHLGMGPLSRWHLMYPFLVLRSPSSNCAILLRGNPQGVGCCVAGCVYVESVHRYMHVCTAIHGACIGMSMYVFMGEHMKAECVQGCVCLHVSLCTFHIQYS